MRSKYLHLNTGITKGTYYVAMNLVINAGNMLLTKK